ncbi:unnamed protein product [Linum trigynum]|uniref:Uncharacterized protein n=1 Tax=Linum trigynum TaxID=586398 RepID=A0AAV2CUK5_9ROSI
MYEKMWHFLTHMSMDSLPPEGNSERDHQVLLKEGEEEPTIHRMVINFKPRIKASRHRFQMFIMVLQPLQPHLHCHEILELDMEFVQGIDVEGRDADVEHKSEVFFRVVKLFYFFRVVKWLYF